MNYTAGLIGCGSIGALKPDNYDLPTNMHPMTHANAITQSNQISLLWAYDNNKEKEKEAGLKWKIKTGIYELISTKVDVIVIATPTETHLSMIQILLGDREVKIKPIIKYKPKLIILEKPAGKNIFECHRIAYLASINGVNLIVNYSRNFVQKITKCIDYLNNKCEYIQNISVYYTRGLLRDGSHAINIINKIAGNFKNGTILMPCFYDYSKNDPTYFAHMTHEKCPHVVLNPCDGELYDIFEMDILTTKHIFSFKNHFETLEIYKAKRDSIYGEYMSNSRDDHYCILTIATDLKYALSYLYEEVVKVLDCQSKKVNSAAPISCTINDALRVHNVIHNLITQMPIKLKGSYNENIS